MANSSRPYYPVVHVRSLAREYVAHLSSLFRGAGKKLRAERPEQTRAHCERGRRKKDTPSEAGANKTLRARPAQTRHYERGRRKQDVAGRRKQDTTSEAGANKMWPAGANKMRKRAAGDERKTADKQTWSVRLVAGLVGKAPSQELPNKTVTAVPATVKKGAQGGAEQRSRDKD